jgi:hypothetical protein
MIAATSCANELADARPGDKRQLENEHRVLRRLADRSQHAFGSGTTCARP